MAGQVTFASYPGRPRSAALPRLPHHPNQD
ncbi:hypothetical protein ABIE67_006790 [Streptomyces sp. V4I8]